MCFEDHKFLSSCWLSFPKKLFTRRTLAVCMACRRAVLEIESSGDMLQATKRVPFFGGDGPPKTCYFATRQHEQQKAGQCSWGVLSGPTGKHAAVQACQGKECVRISAALGLLSDRMTGCHEGRGVAEIAAQKIEVLRLITSENGALPSNKRGSKEILQSEAYQG